MINSVAIAEALAPLHILVPEAVRERFGCKGGGLNVAFVGVFEISPAWVLQNEKRFSGMTIERLLRYLRATMIPSGCSCVSG